MRMYTVYLKDGNRQYVKAKTAQSYDAGKISFYVYNDHGNTVEVAYFKNELVDFYISEEWVEPKPYSHDTLGISTEVNTKMAEEDIYKLTPQSKNRSSKNKTWKEVKSNSKLNKKKRTN